MKHISPIAFTKIVILDDMPLNPIRNLLKRAEEMDISGSDFDAYLNDRMERERNKAKNDPETVFRLFVFDVLDEIGKLDLERRVFNCLRASLHGCDGYDISDRYWKIRKFSEMSDEEIARIRNLGSKTMPLAFTIRNKAQEFVRKIDSPENTVVTTVKIMADGSIDGYLTVEEYANKHGMKGGTVRQQISRGLLKSINVLGKNLIPVNEKPVYKYEKYNQFGGRVKKYD